MRKLSTDLIKSGSFTGSFSGSVIGTITSASFASTASYLLNSFSLTTGSTYPITSSWSNNSISSSFSNTSISSSYSLTSSNLSPVAQDLIPISNSLYSLGSPTNKWKDLYVSTGSIYIGNVVLSTSGSTLYADVQPIVTLNTASGQIEISGMSANLSASYSNTSSVALNAISSSYSLSGSYVKNADISQTSTSASYSNTSSVALNAISSSYGLTSSYSLFANNSNNSLTSTSASYSSTASVALNALTSSYINVATNAVSSSFASTASISVSSSFATTSSYNLNSISSSYSLTASFAANAGSSLSTGSTYPITASWSNNSISSSYATFAVSATSATSANTATSASYATNAGSATSATSANTANSATSASYSLSSSYSVNSTTAISSSFASTASYNLNSISSSFSTNASTASYVVNSISSSYALTSSYALNSSGGGTTLTTGSTYPITSSWANNVITASYALNSSGGSTPVVSVASLNNQTILYNFSSSQEATITGLTLTNNNWGINVVEEWNSASVPGDVYYNSCSLLMHFSGSNGGTTFIDNSPSPKTATPVGNAQISTAQSKFGGSSGYFDGTGDYLTLSSDVAFGTGTGNFTIEFWMYPVSVASGYVFDNRTGAALQSVIGYFSAAGSFTFTGGIISTGVTKTGITANSWYHVACVRNSGTVYLFVDGVSAGTDTVAGSANSSNPFTIGSKYDGTNGFNGYIDDFRYTKGVARYTSSFTVPSSAFPDSSGSFQLQTKYIGLVGGLNDSTVDYGVEKLSDSSLKIRKMTASGQPLSGSGTLSASVDRVYVNVLNYTNVSAGSPLLGQTFTAVGSTSSYALSRSVVNPYEIVVAVDGAVQSFNNAYTVTSSTINFTESIPSGSLVDIRYLTTPNVNSASYALTASYALNGGSGGGTGSTVIVYDVLLNNLYDNVLLTYERKPEQLISITSDDYGTQADGGVTISTAKNISTDTIASGRTVADGVAYLVTAITSSSSTSNITVSGSSVTGIVIGDEMLLINVQGDTTNYGNVGNYEFLRVSNISTNVISFNSPVSKSYGTTDNSAIGNQKVILQRVPNYSTVTITSVGSLTANSWDGSLGGIVSFKCNTLINSGSINANGKGFRFGVGGIRDTGAGCTEYPTPAPAGNRAESYRGLNSVAFCSRLGTSTVSSIGGGGGGGAGVSSTSNRSGGGGGGGANRTNGSNGSNASSGNLGASGGTLYNNGTSLLMFGGGGGGGGRAINGIGGNGGSGGGIVLIYANDFSNAAIINATGSRGVNGTSTDDGGGGGGGGAGGVVFIKSNFVNAVGTLSIAAGGASSGGVGSLYGTGGAGGAGGLGNQLLKYTVANVSVASVTASFESSSLVTTTAVDPNIEDGFVDNYYVYNTVATVVSASWDGINRSYYNTTGSVASLTSYPIRTISSSVVYPTVVRALIFAENNDDDPWVINQDLKFYLSNNGGVSYTTASLVKRGLYETGKFIYSNDINLTSQNTASLTYRLELSSSKVINVYGTGLIWPIDLTVISSSYTAATASFAVTSSFAQTTPSGKSIALSFILG